MPFYVPALAALIVYLYLRARRRRLRAGRALAALYQCDDPASLSGDSPDWGFIDDFLERWDRLAQGSKELAPKIRSDTPRFNAELVRALQINPRAALPRAVMYPVLQVGGFVPTGSKLGQTLAVAMATDPPQARATKAGRAYFAGDLYHWLMAHPAAYITLPLLTEWADRPFAQSTVLPMYGRMRAQATSGAA